MPKYLTNKWKRVRGRLTLVKLMYRDGYTEGQICKFLNIDKNTHAKWKREHPEYAECFIAAKEELADMLERKLYQQALGVVSDNIVHRKTERFTRIVKDEETGEEHELSEIRKSEWVDEAEGTTEGSVKAAEFLLKHLRPEVYGDKVELETEVDTVVIVDDIGNKLNNSDGNMLFYDDSVDAPDGGSDDEQ